MLSEVKFKAKISTQKETQREVSSSSSSQTQSQLREQPHPIKCSYKCCSAKPWFKGFLTRVDYELHMHLHRCQWIDM